MAQNTFPAFTNMIPTVEDIQLIVDSLRQEDRYRITKDGIFTSGIVNDKDDYLSAGTNTNSLKIKPFIAYTSNGNRIEVSDTWDNLYAQGNVINVTNRNLVSQYENIPVWYSYINSYENLTSADTTQTLTLATLGRGSILHGIKLRVNSLFGTTDSAQTSNIYISIGINGEPEKFLPQTNISQSNLSTDLSVMNLMYSLDDENTTDIIITYTSDSANLNTLTNGSLSINLCIANLTGFDNEELYTTTGGYQLNNTLVGSWQPSTTYHIVVRYTEDKSNYRQLNYTTIDGTTISTTSEPTRVTTNYNFFALRKTGTTIDYTTLDDVKLGEIITDTNGDINTIRINGTNINGDPYTDYLTIPGYRFVENINASQIGNQDVTNEQFSYLNSLTSNVQNQLNSKAGLAIDNVLTGTNTFTTQINGSIDEVDGFHAFATPTSNSILVLDENGKIPADAVSESTFSSIGNFYTVSSGITTDGKASYLIPNDSLNGVILTASQENPLVFNYPDGAVEKITSSKEITGLSADGLYYLIKEQNGNYIFLPTDGGTTACVPIVSTGNTFNFNGGQGVVAGSYNNSSAYQAFDGTLNTGTLMGKVTYRNYNNIETITYTPNNIPTSLQVTFPQPINPTAFAASFRKNTLDITPKVWQFEGSNDGITWTQLYSASNATWNENEIQTFNISTEYSFTKFRIIFNISENTINNYRLGEQQSHTLTMNAYCYYFQIYTTLESKGNIVEGYKQPENMTIGSYFLDISKKPYKGYKCTDVNTFVQTNYVKLGFIDVVGIHDVNPIITCYPFCYNTFSISDELPIYLNGDIQFNHNLGVKPNIVNIEYVYIKDSSDESDEDDDTGYSYGECTNNLYVSDVIGLTSVNDYTNKTITRLTLHVGSTTSKLYVRNKLTGVVTETDPENWKAIIYCSRGW